MRLNIDFYVHWLWAATFGLLALSGFALMGARYGWIMNYDLTVADYLHRTMAALYVVLLAVSILIEILRILVNLKVSRFMMVGIGSHQVFTLLSTLLLIISGLFIWVCMEFSVVTLAFCLVIHEIAAFLALGSIIWHIYQKNHVLTI